ncbi:DUF192 domain-containing protein [Yeosuana sp. MJ-SS3]|uniref:DUF192 domain-containing protein n=1 Tax=Gilvirhabdus luticola TaxID=3079858 RepID=A0ABU3U6H2_9FLAO|nr:DUF192 domain-containing protein [Yeosuana sp. MJ-SS3]MDU8885981.1 DUF192 domain-containing protein [Yeosuana sp. MJ-SS3]
MHFKPKHLFTLFIFGCITLGFTSCKGENKEIKQVEVFFKKEGTLTLYNVETDSIIAKVDIEIADSDYEIQTGLMYRSSMKKDQGMLFVFPDELPRSFYMKNTQFPLDIIFINSNHKIVSFQENSKPFNEASLPSRYPAKYVLELNAGMVNEWAIKVGDSISY